MNDRIRTGYGWTLAATGLLVTVGCLPPGDLEPELVEEVSSLSAENSGGLNLGGANLGGSNLGGANLGGANLGGNNLGGGNLGGTNLGGTNLGGNNLGGGNLGGTNLGGTNLGGTNLGGSNLGGTNLGGSNLGGSNLGGANLGGNNLGGTNLGGTNLGGSNAGKNIHGGAATGLVRSGEDKWGATNAGRCVVMGIGGTAFAKLMSQNPGSTFYAAVGKTSWGFSQTSGGPITLEAWEAVVWGSNTYCVFVLGAPPGTTWLGMHGFIKAVFRWNAPPSKSIKISGIAGSPGTTSTIYTYTGMMNAAAKLTAGNITAENYIAGALTLITATTNNISIMVDFSSWVLNGSSTVSSLVLGNVDTVNPPLYTESVYSAVKNSNGTIAILVSMTSGGHTLPETAQNLQDNYKLLSNRYEYCTSSSQNCATFPQPRRCGGWLYLKQRDPSRYPTIPAGKCDNGLTWSSTDNYDNELTWDNAGGTTAPYSSYMLLAASSGGYYGPFCRNVGGSCLRVLAETYMHTYEPAFD